VAAQIFFLLLIGVVTCFTQSLLVAGVSKCVEFLELLPLCTCPGARNAAIILEATGRRTVIEAA
jgi:hypothetical protein